MKKEQIKKVSQKRVNPNAIRKTDKQIKTNRYFDLLGLGVIILLGIIVYSNSFNCSFHFDDFNNIVNNTKIRNLVDVNAWWNVVPSRPLGSLTFALNYHFNQLDVRYYHLVNLIIHLINACLVWWLTRLILSSPVMKNQPIIMHKTVIAFFTAVMFVSHPLATQSVTYIVQRLASLVALFYLFSLALYAKARLSKKSNMVKYLLFTGSVISAVAAMLTKENAFTLPFAIMFFELFFLRTKKLSINFKDYRVILLIVALLCIILIVPLKFSFSIFEPIAPTQGHAYTVTPLNYLFTQFSVIVKYIQVLFLPINQMLDYDFPISNNFFEIRTLLSFVILSTIVIFAIFLYKKHRIISFGIFWFFLTLSIESSFVPIPNVIFEHRTYLPSFGFFLTLSTGLFVLFRDKSKFLQIAVLIIIVVLNSYLTYERNKDWKDELSLWNDNVAKAPRLPRALSNRGYVYENLGEWDKAINDYSSVILIDPNYTKAYFNRAVAYENLKQWDKAITDYSKAIQIDTEYTEAYYNRGNDYCNSGEWDKAITDYSVAIVINKNYTNAFINRGIAYTNIGQWDKAITDFSRAIMIDPNNPEVYYNRSVDYASLRLWDKVIIDCSRAIAIDPKNARAYSNRGVAYANLGQWEKAITEYNSAIELKPDFTDALKNRDIAYKRSGIKK